VAKAFAELSSIRDRALFGLCFLSALRIGEAVALDVSDVWPGGLVAGGMVDAIRVRRTVGRGEVMRDRPKNGERRDVPVCCDLADLLWNLSGDLSRVDGSAPLLQSRNSSGRLTTRQAARVLGGAFKSAGIQRASAHSLRKTWSIHADRGGVSLRVLRSILGHRSIRSTDHYLRMVEDHEKRAAVESVSMPHYWKGGS
jgi:integrase/recombinase XerD